MLPFTISLVLQYTSYIPLVYLRLYFEINCKFHTLSDDGFDQKPKLVGIILMQHLRSTVLPRDRSYFNFHSEIWHVFFFVDVYFVIQYKKLQSRFARFLNKHKLRKTMYIYLLLTFFRKSLTTIYSKRYERKDNISWHSCHYFYLNTKGNVLFIRLSAVLNYRAYYKGRDYYRVNTGFPFLSDFFVYNEVKSKRFFFVIRFYNVAWYSSCTNNEKAIFTDLFFNR